MSSIEIHRPLVKSLNHDYSKRLFEFNDFNVIGSVGKLHKISGFDSYNHLIDINGLFSTEPKFDLIDRTGRISGPLKFSTIRPWKIPSGKIDLETALANRVNDICDLGQKINIFWSGGIDSTTILVSFLQYAPNIDQCRVIFSPWSTYEHPEFFSLLKTIDKIEMIDISGDIYLDFDLDGVFVSGNTGDEMHASLDESFFDEHGYDFLFTPWRDFFYRKTRNDDLIAFCEYYFSAAGRDITTVLEARWWFYAMTKLHGMLNFTDLNFLNSGTTRFDPNRLIGFFDYGDYERFIYFNSNDLIRSSDYASWRQFLKDYCYRYDGFDDWCKNKRKFGSRQTIFYSQKKIVMNDCRYLLVLDDGQRVATQNLPLFSRSEWEDIQEEYRYVFNQTNLL